VYRAHPSDGIAWVTGASSGIGQATAIELARRGYVVVATARRAPLLQSVAQLARGLRGRIEPLVGDVADRAAMKAAVRRIEADFGPIALAFFNVGIFAADAADDFGADGFRQTFDINVMGTMNCLGPALQAMIGRGKGQIAINASIAGYGGLPRSAAYGASKAALINYAEGIYFALKLRGLNVQIVNPGFVRTPLTDNNTFPMPFLVTADKAARRICDGFEHGGFEITFPKRLSFAFKAINLLPYRLYFWTIARVTGAR
jgi:NAD(P)-dependent dehydrogenase (short-subunit alcohol dehydrogenase family)